MVLKLFIDRFSSCLVRLDIQATAESEGKDDDVVVVCQLTLLSIYPRKSFSFTLVPMRLRKFSMA